MSDEQEDIGAGPDEGSVEAGAGGNGEEGGEGAVTEWHVREGGMRYTFPSVTSVAELLRKRESFDGIEVSVDGGETWLTVWEVPELASVEPATPRKRVKSTAEAEGETGAAASPKPAPAGRAGPSPQSRASSSEGEGGDMKKRLMALGAVLVVAVIALVVYYGSQGEPTMPNTPAGQQAAWVIQQLNTDGSGLTADVLRGRYADSVAESINFEQLSRQLGAVARGQSGVRFTGTAGANSATAIDARITNDAQLDGVIVVQVSPDSGRITAMSILSGAQYEARNR